MGTATRHGHLISASPGAHRGDRAAGVSGGKASAAAERSAVVRAAGPHHLIGGGAHLPRRPDHGAAEPRGLRATAGEPGIIGAIVARVAAWGPLRSRLGAGTPRGDLRKRAGGLGPGPQG